MQQTKISGWGRFPSEIARLFPVYDAHAARQYYAQQFQGICRGMGRSYGDSALSENVLDCRGLDHFIDFNPETGRLSCEAGVTIRDLNAIFLPRGFCLPVTPGTQDVSIGGAIASDVHGKNHEQAGCFSGHVLEFQLIAPSGNTMRCSQTENSDWFHATCGGMGLTGLISRSSLQLRKIRSTDMLQQFRVGRNLDELLDHIEDNTDAEYSVAWVDTLTTGAQMGRGVLSLASHAVDGNLRAGSDPRWNVPTLVPGMVLNRFTMRLFNSWYYWRLRRHSGVQRIHYNDFFYPLDVLRNWNRLYGSSGFLQYQFVIPDTAGRKEFTRIFNAIVNSKRGSFLSVLKRFGPENENYLSFPLGGYTLAVDFKRDAAAMRLMEKLDELVVDAGGRVYLTKDARLGESMFKRMYSRWETFYDFRERNHLSDCVYSLQSKRLGI